MHQTDWRCAIRITRADLERRVEVLNKRFNRLGPDRAWTLDSNDRRYRLCRLSGPSRGERDISPRLRNGLLYDWIGAYMEGMEDVGADLMTAALKVLTLTPAIRAWLEANDPKALEQAEQALR